MLAQLKGSIPRNGDVVITAGAVVGPVSPVLHGQLSRSPPGVSVTVRAEETFGTRRYVPEV
jgi:hypothetical protein